MSMEEVFHPMQEPMILAAAISIVVGAVVIVAGLTYFKSGAISTKTGYQLLTIKNRYYVYRYSTFDAIPWRYRCIVNACTNGSS